MKRYINILGSLLILSILSGFISIKMLLTFYTSLDMFSGHDKLITEGIVKSYNGYIKLLYLLNFLWLFTLIGWTALTIHLVRKAGSNVKENSA